MSILLELSQVLVPFGASNLHQIQTFLKKRIGGFVP